MALCIIQVSGLLVTKIAGFLCVPKVTGYIVAGISIGPSGLGLIGSSLPVHMDFALLLGAVATATAPVSTIMTIKQDHARGEFVRILLRVVTLDDAVCLLAFSFASAVVPSDFNGGRFQRTGHPRSANIAAGRWKPAAEDHTLVFCAL